MYGHGENVCENVEISQIRFNPIGGKETVMCVWCLLLLHHRNTLTHFSQWLKPANGFTEPVVKE